MSAIPCVPEAVIGDSSASGLVAVWENALKKIPRNDNCLAPAPTIILAVTFFRMTNLIPQDALHPLYADECRDLANTFILDSLSTDSLNMDDLHLSAPEGVTLKSMSGKHLVFKKTENGKLNVNGIEVEKTTKVGEGEKSVVILVLKNFLFNHYQDVQEAFGQISKQRLKPF